MSRTTPIPQDKLDAVEAFMSKLNWPTRVGNAMIDENKEESDRLKSMFNNDWSRVMYAVKLLRKKLGKASIKRSEKNNSEVNTFDELREHEQAIMRIIPQMEEERDRMQQECNERLRQMDNAIARYRKMTTIS